MDDNIGGKELSGGGEHGQITSDLSLLATARGALDSTCRRNRHSVVLDAVLHVLHGQESMTAKSVHVSVGKLLRTQSITQPLIDRALQDAHAADLVREQTSLLEDNGWRLSEAAVREVSDDSAWARRVVERFDKEAAIRLDGDEDRDSINDDRIPRLAADVRQALAIGSEGLYAVEPASSVATLRPVQFNEHGALAHVRALQPRSARRAAERLLLAALNPDDDFGDEYIHLLVACNVLHGLATGRASGSKPDLSGTRILLDTNVAVDLASPGTPEAKTIEELIRLSVDNGVEVVFPKHCIAEWIGLFDSEPISDPSMTPDRLGMLGMMASSPFIKGFGAETSDNAGLTWSEFAAKWRDPTRELERLGATVRTHGNHSDDDRKFYETVLADLTTLNRERGKAGRTLKKAPAMRADAESLAMVARWRQNSSSDRAFLITNDRMLPQAYSSAHPTDKVCATMTPAAWLILVATLTVDDPDRQTELAKVIGNGALRNSFFGLASTYTYEEICAFGETLRSESDEIEPEDLNTFVQHTLDGFEKETQLHKSVNDARLQGAQVLLSRSARKSQQARRVEEAVAEKVATAVTEVEKRADLERRVADAESKERVELVQAEAREARQLAEKQAAELADQEGRIAKLKRLIVVGVLMALAVVVAAVLWSNDVIKGETAYAVLAALVLAALAGARIVTHGVREAGWWLAAAVAFPVLLQLIFAAID